MLAKILNAVSALVLSAILFGTAFPNTAQAMNGEEFPFNNRYSHSIVIQGGFFSFGSASYNPRTTSTRAPNSTEIQEQNSDSLSIAHNPMPGIVIDEKLPDEMLVQILQSPEIAGRTSQLNKVALISKHFLALICEPMFNRTMKINSPQRFREFLSAPEFPSLASVPEIRITARLAPGIDSLSVRNLLLKCSSCTFLNLGENGIDSDGAKAIAAALPGFSRLRKLDLYKNNFGTQGARDLVKSLALCSSLTALRLDDNSIGLEGAASFAEHLGNSPLESLNLSSNQMGVQGSAMGVQGAELIFNALKTNTCLTKLSMNLNQIDAKGTEAIANFLKTNRTLTTLSLADNKIRDSGCILIADALKSNSFLKSVELTRNKISNTGAEHIATALKTNSTLTELKMNGNTIGDEGCMAFIDPSSPLKVLQLSSNQISNVGGDAWIRFLKPNPILKLDLGGNSMDREKLREIYLILRKVGLM